MDLPLINWVLDAAAWGLVAYLIWPKDDEPAEAPPLTTEAI